MRQPEDDEDEANNGNDEEDEEDDADAGPANFVDGSATRMHYVNTYF